MSRSLIEKLSWDIKNTAPQYFVATYYYDEDNEFNNKQLSALPEDVTSVDSAMGYIAGNINPVNDFKWHINGKDCGFMVAMLDPEEMFVPSIFYGIAKSKDTALKILDVVTDTYFESEEIEYDYHTSREIAQLLESECED